jgi:hypothetical protein
MQVKLKNDFLEVIFLSRCFACLDPDQDPPHSAKKLTANPTRRGLVFYFVLAWTLS